MWLRQASASIPIDSPAQDEAASQSRLESILFLAKEPLPSRKIALLADIKDGREVRRIIGSLNKQYDSRGQSFRIEQIAGGYRYMTKQAYSSWIRRLEAAPALVRFSRPAIETLSVIAYQQPVMRAEVEAVRGVGCGEVIRQLMDRGFVRISGRSEDLGRPFLYSTSKGFLEIFGLNTLEELPGIDFPTLTTAQVDDPAEQNLENSGELLREPDDEVVLEAEKDQAA